MSKALTFQEVILRLQRYWSDYGCTIWQPYSEKVGAGTAVQRTGAVVRCPVGRDLLGRVIDPLGRPGIKIRDMRGTDLNKTPGIPLTPAVHCCRFERHR